MFCLLIKKKDAKFSPSYKKLILLPFWLKVVQNQRNDRHNDAHPQQVPDVDAAQMSWRAGGRRKGHEQGRSRDNQGLQNH